MSIERQYGKVVFECDGDHCFESHETERDDWNEARSSLRQAGWVTVKDGQSWLHFCSKDCLNGY